MIFIVAGLSTANAQVDTTFNQVKISFPTYLNQVGSRNLGHVAEKFKVSIAFADALSARVFPDPELSIGAADHGQRRMKAGYEFDTGLAYTLELGGKRRARINLANREAELAQLSLGDYFRHLRADATIAYLTAIKEHRLLKVKISSYEQMKALSVSDSIRLKLGAINKIDARQSRLEAGSQLNEVFQQESAWKEALIQLNEMTGSMQQDTLFNPEGDFDKFNRSFDIKKLILDARESRTDLLVALKTGEIAQSSFDLVKANRRPDLGFSVGLASSSVVANVVAPTPSTTTVSLGLTIPLKFSNNNKGALKSASFALEQSKVIQTQTELQIETEVRQAYAKYIAGRKQLGQFESGMMEDAKQVLQGKIYAYKRGETSLLEVLTAQKTFNEVQESYLETLYNNAVALLELERSAGIWDINF